MAQSQAAPEHVSASTPVNDLIVRSNAYNDLRPFIEHLWVTQGDMCCNVYPDQFPRGKHGNATKEEEDEFLLRYFSISTLQSQGGRFLKQALYSIARYNEDTVLEFAARWSAKHRDYYEDRSMLMGMCGDVAESKNFFETSECAGHPASFLERAIKVIRHGLRQLQEAQDKERSTETRVPSRDAQPPAPPVRVEILQRTRDLAEAGAGPVPSPDPGRNVTEVLSTVPQGRAVHERPSDTPRAEPMPQQPSSTRFEPRQPYRHGRGSLRRTSGNMHPSPTPTTPFPAFTQNMPGSDVTRSAFPDFDPTMVFISDHHGYFHVSQPIMADPRFLAHNVIMTPEQYGGHVYGPMAQQENISLMDPQSHPRSNGASFVYHQNSPRGYSHRPSGSTGPRRGRGSFSNNNYNHTRNMDPNSFDRFPQERFSQERFPQERFHPRTFPHRSGGHRLSMHSASSARRPSGLSNEGWQPHRDKPFDTPTRRVSIEQPPPPLVPASALERKIEASDPVQQAPTTEAAHPRIDTSDHSLRTRPPAHVSWNDPDWACNEFYIGRCRTDVLGLVAANIPNELGDEEIQSYLGIEVKCIRVSSPGGYSAYPRAHVHDRIIFVNFNTLNDTRDALDRRDLKFKDAPILFKVPWKYWKKEHHDYQSPSRAKARIEAGLPPYISRPRQSSFEHHQVPAGTRLSYSGNSAAREPRTTAFSARYNALDDSKPFDASAASSASVAAMPHTPSGDKVDVTDVQSQKSSVPLQNTQSSATPPTVSAASTPRKKNNKKTSKKSAAGAKAGLKAEESLPVSKNQDETKKISSESSPAILTKRASGDRVEEESLSHAAVARESKPVAVSELPNTYLVAATTSTATQTPKSPLPALSPTHVTNTPSNERAEITDITKSISTTSSAAKASAHTSTGEAVAEANKEVSDSGMDASQERRSSSSKAADDIDESFQTAVETPESIKVVVSGEIERKDSKADVVDSAGIGVSEEESQSAEQSPTAHRSVSADKTSLPSGSTTAISSHPVEVPSKKPEVLKAGPKVTESLSPFARQAQPKKTKKTKSGKNKNKIQADTVSQGQDLKQSDVSLAKQSSAKKENDPAAMIASHSSTSAGTSNTNMKTDEPMQESGQASMPFFPKLRAGVTNALNIMGAGKPKDDSVPSKASQVPEDRSKPPEIGSQDTQGVPSSEINEDISGTTTNVKSGKSRAKKSHSQPEAESAPSGEEQADSNLSPQLTNRASGSTRRPKKPRKGRKQSSTEPENLPSTAEGGESSSATLSNSNTASPAKAEAAYNLLNVSENDETSVSEVDIEAFLKSRRTVVQREPRESKDPLKIVNQAPSLEEVMFNKLGISHDVLHLLGSRAGRQEATGGMSEIEQSRLKLQELEHQERLRKLRKREADELQKKQETS